MTDECAMSKKEFKTSDFSIGHRGAPLQFPEHTEASYRAAARMGAGILECDVTFTSDLELVCRHSQCDLHTTTNVVTIPELNAKCTTPWAPGVKPKCCTSDFTLKEIKTLCAKMDASNDVNAETAEGYAFGGTPDFRTDMYSSECERVLTHVESIELFKGLGAKMTPELKAPGVEMPFNGFSQEDYAAKMINDYKKAGVPAEHVWAQSANLDDIKYWVENSDYGAQAVALDFEDDREGEDADAEWLEKVKATGGTIVAPPMWKLVSADGETIVSSKFAEQTKAAGMAIISWTLDRTNGPLGDGEKYYWQSLQKAGITLNEGSRLELLDALAQKVGIAAIFDDWAATATFYANCMGLGLRD